MEWKVAAVRRMRGSQPLMWAVSRHMKRYSIVSLALFPLIAVCSKTAHVSVGGTELCFPSRFVPGPNAYISIVTRGLPKADETLIYVPAKEVQEAIPKYVLSHPNQYTPAVMHDLNLLVSTSRGLYSNLQQEAWSIRTSGVQHLIEPDERTGYTRIYPHSEKRTYLWHMTLTPPPPSSEPGPPEDWYVGYCLDNPGSFSCKQLVDGGSVQLWFDIDASNLMLRREIGEYAKRRISEWTAACAGYQPVAAVGSR